MRHWVNVAAASVGIYLALVAVDVWRWFLDAAFVLSLAAGTLRVVEWYKVLGRLERVVSGVLRCLRGLYLDKARGSLLYPLSNLSACALFCWVVLDVCI